GAVIEAVPAIGKENMAAHFAGQWCAGFLQLGLDQGVAGAPHQRPPAVLADNARQFTAALHVKDDVGAGHAREYVARIQHHQAIRPDDFALRRYHAEAVAITVKSKAEICTVLAYSSNQ